MCVNNFWQSCRKEGSGAHERGSLKGMEEGSIWWKVLHEEPKNNEPWWCIRGRMEVGSIWWKVLHEEPKNNELDAEEPLQRAPQQGEEVHPQPTDSVAQLEPPNRRAGRY